MTVNAEIIVSAPCGAWQARLPEALSLCRRAALAAVEDAIAGAAIPALASGSLAMEASVVLADDDFVRKLNREYRGRDEATNVLSFAAFDASGPSQAQALGRGGDGGVGPLLLGDVVLAFDTVAAEAAGQGKSFEAHLCHMAVHGMLHLLGYDHDSEGPAITMERLETLILQRMGYPDPYVVEQAAT
ncbi:MAG: rRNA maturation RNase YbeY [Alphaproteobacteria bacterium]